VETGEKADLADCLAQSACMSVATAYVCHPLGGV
jgi:hypothetical protein